jgi:cytosine/creatinine deaminase
MPSDTVLRNARLADGRHVHIRVENGMISAVVDTASLDESDGSSHDLGGWLVLPAMAEPHAHLDKALTAERVPNPDGDLMGAIVAWNVAAERGMFTHDDIVARATRAMELLLVSGVTVVRTHVNVGKDAGASSVFALREAAARFEGLLDVQLTALTHSPMTGPGSEGNRAALDAAIEAGVDLVGGCPHLEPDAPSMIADTLRLASDTGLDVDLHVDETLDPEMSTLRELARQVQETGFAGSVAASHCVSLGMQPPDVQAAVSREVAAAGIAVFPLPQTNLFLQARDRPTATPRGLTAIAALRDAGVLVAAGADNVQDPFNLVGRSDPLETAALLVMAAHVLPDDAFAMVSNDVRQALGHPRISVEVGDPADLVAIDAPSVRGAIADAPMSRRIFRAGRLVASSDTQTVIHR